MSERRLKRQETIPEESKFVTDVPKSGGGSEAIPISGPADKAAKKIKENLK